MNGVINGKNYNASALEVLFYSSSHIRGLDSLRMWAARFTYVGRRARNRGTKFTSVLSDKRIGKETYF